ncbi:hypothetical protein ACFL0D_06515 [Thermoproteota archaeon]
MRDYSFFKKTLSYLSALEKGHADKLVKEEWVTKEEVKRIITILEKLFLVKKKEHKLDKYHRQRFEYSFIFQQ